MVGGPGVVIGGLALTMPDPSSFLASSGLLKPRPEILNEWPPWSLSLLCLLVSRTSHSAHRTAHSAPAERFPTKSAAHGWSCCNCDSHAPVLKNRRDGDVEEPNATRTPAPVQVGSGDASLDLAIVRIFSGCSAPSIVRIVHSPEYHTHTPSNIDYLVIAAKAEQTSCGSGSGSGSVSLFSTTYLGSPRLLRRFPPLAAFWLLPFVVSLATKVSACQVVTP